MRAGWLIPPPAPQTVELVGLVRKVLARSDDARALVRELMRPMAYLLLDWEQQTLTVRLHHFPSRLQD